jgi:hypothetical protein
MVLVVEIVVVVSNTVLVEVLTMTVLVDAIVSVRVVVACEVDVLESVVVVAVVEVLVSLVLVVPIVEELVELVLAVDDVVELVVLLLVDDVVVQGTSGPGMHLPPPSQWSTVQGSPSSHGQLSGLSAQPVGSQSVIEAVIACPATSSFVTSRRTGAMQSNGIRKASIMGVTASG